MDNHIDIKNFILDNYSFLEPIFLEDLPFGENEIKLLIEENVITNYSEGIFVRPPKNGFILKKPIIDKEKAVFQTFIKTKKGERIGFFSGSLLLNQMGFSTQVPSYFIITTNNFPDDAIEGKPYLFLENIKCILHRPLTKIKNDNWKEEQYKEILRLVGINEMIKKRKNFQRYCISFLNSTEEDCFFNKFCLNEKQN